MPTSSPDFISTGRPGRGQRDLRRKSLVLRIATLAGAAMLAAGCSGPSALRSSYVDYANAHAEVNNQQLLLNLARIHNRHPPYFLQLGPITAQFSFTKGFNASASRTESDSAVAGSFARVNGLGFSGTATESPLFNFAPLSGPAFGSLLLRPLDLKVVNSLATQGMSAGMLLRMSAASMTLNFAGGDSVTLQNYYDPADPENYADFLRLAAMLDYLIGGRMLDVQTDERGVFLYPLAEQTVQKILRRGAEKPEYQIRAFSGKQGAARLVITPRTFIGMLHALAYDADAYDSLPDSITANVPASQRTPLLRIKASPDMTAPPAATLDYAGVSYTISDLKGSNRNRSTFQALGFLFSQVELSPKDVPTPQLVQVR